MQPYNQQVKEMFKQDGHCVSNLVAAKTVPFFKDLSVKSELAANAFKTLASEVQKSYEK